MGQFLVEYAVRVRDTCAYDVSVKIKTHLPKELAISAYNKHFRSVENTKLRLAGHLGDRKKRLTLVIFKFEELFE